MTSPGVSSVMRVRLCVKIEITPMPEHDFQHFPIADISAAVEAGLHKYAEDRGANPLTGEIEIPADELFEGARP